MVENPYIVLGVPCDAVQDDIRKAYRQLAKELHPDLHPGKELEEKFKQVSAAYDLLNSPEKRACFDRSEIGADTDFYSAGFTGTDDAAFYSGGRSSRVRHLYHAPLFGWRWTYLANGSYRFCRWTDGRLGSTTRPPPRRVRRRRKHPKIEVEGLRPLIDVALDRFSLHDEVAT